VIYVFYLLVLCAYLLIVAEAVGREGFKADAEVIMQAMIQAARSLAVIICYDSILY